MSRDVRVYLEDIIESCDDVIAFVEGIDYDGFLQDRKTVKAVTYSVLIIGEAAKHVPPDLRARHPEVKWQQITGMRDVVAHAYASVRAEVLWKVARHEVPLLRAHIERILAELPGESPPG